MFAKITAGKTKRGSVSGNCSVAECGKVVYKQSYCVEHYNRHRDKTASESIAPKYLVYRTIPGLSQKTKANLQDMAKPIQRAVEKVNKENKANMEWWYSLVLPEDKMVCYYSAREEKDIKDHSAAAHLPVDSIVKLHGEINLGTAGVSDSKISARLTGYLIVRKMPGIEKKTQPELNILANQLAEVSRAIDRERPHAPSVKHTCEWRQSFIVKDQEIAFFEASTAPAVMYHCHVSDLAVGESGEVLVNRVDKILFRFDKTWITDTGSDDDE